MTPVPVWRKARAPRFTAVAAVCLLVSQVLGGPSLLLTDGREIKGDDLRMEGDLYMLTSRGTVVPIPKQAVKSVKWVEDQPSNSAPIANMVTSKTDAERQEDAQYRAARKADADAQAAAQKQEEDAARQQATARRGGGSGSGSGPAYTTDSQGIQHWNQRGVTLAGPDIRPPTAQEQLAVFGEPAKFAQDVVEFDLHPTYWVPDPNEGVMEGMPPMTPPRNDTWVPSDGFAK
jgi:hypothetical protein